MPVYIDTSAIYAILDETDISHEAAAATWHLMDDRSESLFTSNYVLLETVALLQGRLGLESVRVLETRVVPLLTIRWVDRDLHTRATGALLTAGRRNLSLVDCVSFEVMREMDLDTAFVFDAHFTEQGFRLAS